MAYPTNISFSYSYTGFQQSQGDNSFPGTYLDNDLASVRDTVNNTLDFLRTSLASDGRLKSQSVGLSQLAFEIRSLFGAEALALVDAVAGNIALTPVAGLDATDLQAAIAELVLGKAEADHSHSASSIPVSAIAKLSAATVQAAIAELRALGPQTGDAVLTFATVAPAGWVMMDDGTIGSVASAASTRANADCEDLFKLLWNSITDTYAPVVTGRGASAAADWAANKKITLPKQLGRLLGISGAGSGLTVRSLGQVLGAESKTLTEANLPAHKHAQTAQTPTFTYGTTAANFTNNASPPSALTALTIATTGQANTVTTNADATPGETGDGNGAAETFSLMNPSSFWNVRIKL